MVRLPDGTIIYDDGSTQKPNGNMIYATPDDINIDHNIIANDPGILGAGDTVPPALIVPPKFNQIVLTGTPAALSTPVITNSSLGETGAAIASTIPSSFATPVGNGGYFSMPAPKVQATVKTNPDAALQQKQSKNQIYFIIGFVIVVVILMVVKKKK